MSEHQHDHPQVYCPACVEFGESQARSLIADQIMREPIPNGLYGQPNKKAWFIEGARWAADVARAVHHE